MGDKLFCMPNRVPVKVLQLWLDQDEVSYLIGGENARVKLSDISDEDIQPGYVLSPRGELAIKSVRKFEVSKPLVLWTEPPTGPQDRRLSVPTNCATSNALLAIVTLKPTLTL